jgi:DNA-binding HxlR family transcriptional regulator
MRGYGQFCPVALGAEVFAERWTPLILRELLAGSHRFSELQRGLPRVPRALLAQRLGSLEHAGLIERRPTRTGRGWEYHLSPAGLSFGPVVEALGQWGYQWAAERLRPDNLDAGLLMWFLRRRLQVDRLPAGRVTVQFEFRDADKRCFWLVLHRPDVDLCLADPGFDTDLCVTTDVRTFTRVYLGHVSIAHALGEGSVTVAGRSDLRRAFGGWLGLSPFASPRAEAGPREAASLARLAKFTF